MTDLVVLLNGVVAGHVTARDGRMSFAYDPAWRGAAEAYPLSLSMPMTRVGHPHEVVEAFLWNLLPDNERTLERWARQFHVSARNALALIAQVGEDCAGAVQCVRPDRLDAVLAGADDRVDWLDDHEIGRRLRSVIDDASSGRTAGDNGQFSLAGAQPKTSLLFDGTRWGIPSGRIPTTHILKPPAPALPGHAENEHVCLRLAGALGLPVARSSVRSFDGQAAIVVERYDRVATAPGPAGLVRLHQEDMCQALGRPPWQKYENEGGPNAATIAGLIREHAWSPTDRGTAAQRDGTTFLDALLFNWMIGGTDAHAKNYALLIGGQRTVRLAPLYDIASAYGFADIQPQKMKLAMKVEHYRVERIAIRHWQRWAAQAGYDPDFVVARIGAMAGSLPGAVATVAAAVRADGLAHPVIDRLETRLTARAAQIAAMA